MSTLTHGLRRLLLLALTRFMPAFAPPLELPMQVSTTGGHDPDLPFMIVDRVGFQLSLDRVGALWDGPTVRSIEWGPTIDGAHAGVVTLKDGTKRKFADSELLTPYLKAWLAKKKDIEAEAAVAAAAAAAAVQATEQAGG